MFETRKLRGSDIEFITSTWLKNYRAKSKFAKSMKRDVFMKEHHDLVKDAISRSWVLVACNKENPDHIMGYLVASRDLKEFHYVYIKGAFRGFGIASKLIESSKQGDSCTVTHEGMENFFRRFYDDVTYNPYNFFTGA